MSMNKFAKDLINKKYLNVRFTLNNVFPYGEVLCDLIKQCNTFTELLISPLNSKITFTWCALNEFIKHRDFVKEIRKIDLKKKINSVSFNKINKELYELEDLSQDVGIDFKIIKGGKIGPKIKETDMLFLYFILQDKSDDERERIAKSILVKIKKYAPSTKKYIVLYDRSFISNKVDVIRNNSYSVKELTLEFLQQNNDWSFFSGYNTEYGLTILTRLSSK